jgi:hypothetical protein
VAHIISGLLWRPKEPKNCYCILVRLTWESWGEVGQLRRAPPVLVVVEGLCRVGPMEPIWVVGPPVVCSLEVEDCDEAHLPGKKVHRWPTKKKID